MKIDIVLKTDQHFYGPVIIDNKELTEIYVQVENQSDPRRNGVWYVRWGLWERCLEPFSLDEVSV